MYMRIDHEARRIKDLGGLFKDLLVLQGIDPELFHGIVGNLMNESILTNLRVEISGNGNTYPINPGRLVLVADYSGEMKNSEDAARQSFERLRDLTSITFNDPTYFGDERQPMYSAYAIGSRTSGDGKDNGCLLVVVKGKKLEEIV